MSESDTKGLERCFSQASSSSLYSSSSPIPDTSDLREQFFPPILPPIRRHSAAPDIGTLGHIPTQRSLAAMRGLLLAEVGDSMVQLDVYGTGFQNGQRIAPPPGGTSSHSQAEATLSDSELLNHDDTLLTLDSNPARNAAELKSLLGNTSSRLKPGAAVISPPSPSIHRSGNMSLYTGKTVALEQAKTRVRVEVDIILETNTCVQGSYVKGRVRVHVRETLKTEPPIWLGKGRVRIIGFECINENDRHTFYQCTTALSTDSGSLYTSPMDDEGFSEAKEGTHVFPFVIRLPVDDSCGTPRGIIRSHSGATVQYIAMASFKVKCTVTNERSIAHFYRNCEIWPRLEYATIFTPASKPLSAQVSKGLFLGGKGKVNLTAKLHRLHWFAGQRCYLNFSITNDTKKAVKRLTLALVRTTTVFKPHPQLDALPGACSDPDACQTSTTRRHITSSVLEIAHNGEKRHASAKGWWTGVHPGQKLDFSHSLLLPPDALTFTRIRLLEVEYTIRVTLGAGSLGADVHVVLPIRIVNFISVDPPPSFSPQDSPQATHEGRYFMRESNLLHCTRTGTSGAYTTRPALEGGFAGVPYSDYDSEITPRTVATAQFDDVSGGQVASDRSVSVHAEEIASTDELQLVDPMLYERPGSEIFGDSARHASDAPISGARPQGPRDLFSRPGSISVSRPGFALVDPGPGSIRRPTSFQSRVQQKIQAQAHAHPLESSEGESNDSGYEGSYLEPYDITPLSRDSYMKENNTLPASNISAEDSNKHKPPPEIRWKSTPAPTSTFSTLTTPTCSAAPSPTSIIPGVPFRPSHTLPRPPMMSRLTDPGPRRPPPPIPLPPPVQHINEYQCPLASRESETFILPVFKKRSDVVSRAQSHSHTHSRTIELVSPGFSVKSRVLDVEGKVEELKQRADGTVPFY